MSRRGPQPLPANVHMLRGNPSKKSAADLMDGLQPQVEIPGCPRHLLPEARKEWRRITPELERYGLVSKLDRSALALYCQAWARWVWAEEQLQRDHEAAVRGMEEAAAKGLPWKGGDGYTVPTPAGYMTYSPHWVISNKAAEQVKRYLAAFGLEPASRSAVAVSHNRQAALFEDDKPAGGFDDF
jgi:P27 family predicted phage terminase small subunit